MRYNTRKSARIGGRHVVLVCGPPGSGKSSYVAERSKPGDVVVDYDALSEALGRHKPYDYPAGLHPFVCEARDALIHKIGVTPVRAWVIHGAANAQQRRELAAKLGATETVVLDVDPETCKHRTAGRHNARQIADWIDAWWKAYRAG